MRFQVPQFIETETKIIGPLTLMQFLFVAGGVSSSAAAFMLIGGGLFGFIAIFVLSAIFGALAFARVDGQPLLNFLAYSLAYALGTKRYLYRTPTDQSDKLTPPHGPGTINY